MCDLFGEYEETEELTSQLRTERVPCNSAIILVPNQSQVGFKLVFVLRCFLQYDVVELV